MKQRYDLKTLKESLDAYVNEQLQPKPHLHQTWSKNLISAADTEKEQVWKEIKKKCDKITKSEGTEICWTVFDPNHELNQSIRYQEVEMRGVSKDGKLWSSTVYSNSGGDDSEPVQIT